MITMGADKVLLAQSPAGHAFERVNQLGQLHGGRVLNEQVDVVVLPIEFHQGGSEVGTHVCEHALEQVQVLGREHSAAVLGNEDQVYVESENTAPTSADLACGCHRPSVH